MPVTKEKDKEKEIEDLSRTVEECDQRDRAFARRLYELGDSPRLSGDAPKVARERDQLREDIHENWERARLARQRIGQIEEQAKRERLETTLFSDGYRQACLDGVGALEAILGPWGPLFRFTIGDRHLPPMPPHVALLALQCREWLEKLMRLKVLKDGDIPESLRVFLEGAK